MRAAHLAVLAILAAATLAPTTTARADPPRVVELPAVHIRARGPAAFTTIARSRPEERMPELRADLVHEVPRTVRRAPF